MDYLAHLVGVLLNHLFVPACRVSQQYDKDHMVLWQSEAHMCRQVSIFFRLLPQGFGQQASRCLWYTPRQTAG